MQSSPSVPSVAPTPPLPSGQPLDPSQFGSRHVQATKLAKSYAFDYVYQAARDGYKLTPSEQAHVHQCRTQKIVNGFLTGTILSALTFSLARRRLPPSAVYAATLVPVSLFSALNLSDLPCRARLTYQLDSPLGAHIRIALRAKFPDNLITAACDHVDTQQPERDKQLVSRVPAAGRQDQQQRGEEMQSSDTKSEADVMVITEDEMHEDRSRISSQLPASQRHSPPTLSSPSAAPSLLPTPSSIPSSHPSVSSPPPRSRVQPTTAHDTSDDNPFTDDSPSNRHPSTAAAVEAERRRRRDEQARLRKQHEDERRQRMDVRNRQQGGMAGARAVGEVNARRSVRRNEFGDEVYDDS